jgi:anti-anti-sigma factor
MSFEITVTQRPPQNGMESSGVTLAGSLELAVLGKASKALAAVVAANPKVIVIDLARLTFIDSSGIGLLLKTRVDLESKGGKVFVTNMQPSIRKVFDIVKALPGTAIFKSTKEMDDYLKAIQEQVREEE